MIRPHRKPLSPCRGKQQGGPVLAIRPCTIDSWRLPRRAVLGPPSRENFTRRSPDPNRRIALRILLLSEGNPETWDSWSGSAKSLLEHLRLGGHEVVTGDVELYGLPRWLAAAETVSPTRSRWWSRFHLDEGPFRRRSRIAGQHIARERGNIDLVLQIGATFEPRGLGTVPYAVYCDSNIRVAERGASTGYSDAFSLTADELEGVRNREQRVYEGASIVFAMSDYLRSSFRDDFRLPEERLRTVYAGLNLDVSRIPRHRPRADGPPTILFVGRQFERKGGDVLLRAFRQVREHLPDARLLIVGPPALELREPGVVVLGFLDKSSPEGWSELLRAYEESHAFCMPTRYEPFGIAFLESMFFSLPCVGTDSWAIPEMVVDGETGFLVPVDDAGAVARRLLQLLEDPELSRRMGEAGRRRAELHFTWSAVVERMNEAFLGLVPAARA